MPALERSKTSIGDRSAGRWRNGIRKIDRLLGSFLLVLIVLYRVGLSWLFRGSCRFVPSCSAYATEAILRYGGIRGLMMAVRRVGRCHPFHPGGFDPVP